MNCCDIGNSFMRWPVVFPDVKLIIIGKRRKTKTEGKNNVISRVHISYTTPNFIVTSMLYIHGETDY